MANETRYYKTPFGQNGNKTEVPDVSVGGAVGYDTGFGPDYDLPQDAVGRKRIERDKYNGVMNSVTGNLKQWQENLYPTWIEDNGDAVPFSYSEGMIVSLAGVNYISLENANQEEPGTGSKWTIKPSLISENATTGVNFDTVADMIGGVSSGGQDVSFSDLHGLSSHILLKTAVDNAISGNGGAEYVLTNVNPGNLSALYGSIWGGRNHDLGGGFYAKLADDNSVDLSQYGLPLPDMTDNATVLNGAVNYAYENNIKNIVCNVSATIDPAAYIKHKANVWFVGTGSLNGLYRVRVQNPAQAIIEPKYKNIKPHQLSRFNATKSPVVVSMGDSISTGGESAQGPNAVAFPATQWQVLISEIESQNKNKNITFVNRGIGGQTWLNANDNTRPSVGVVPWYTIDQPWLQYVEELEPDLVILAFGMNDSNGFNAGAMVSAVNTIKAWAKVPDILFITTPVPALSTDLSNDGFGFVGEVFQEGRDQVASYTRGYCEFYDYPYIDINRRFTICRDGYDPCTSNLERRDTGVSGTSGAYTSTTGSRDFSITAYITGLTAGEIEDEFNGVNGVLTTRIGLNSNDLLFLQNAGNDTILVNQFASGLNSYSSIDTEVPFPTTDFSLTVSVSNCTLTILLDGTKIYENQCVRQGALFPVQMGRQGFASGPYSSFDFNTGKSVSVGKRCTDLDIWGVSEATADTKLPFGGNGVNHYCSSGIELIVRPAVQNERFFGDRVQDLLVSPYPLTINEHMTNWTAGEIDDWTRLTATLLTETVGGIHGEPSCAEFGTYPCGIQQDCIANISRTTNYVLVLIAKVGTVYGLNSAGYVAPHSTRVDIDYNDGSPQTLSIPIAKQKNLGSDWTVIEIDLESENGATLPPYDQITAITPKIYLTSGSSLAYAGLHEIGATTKMFKRPF